MIPVDPQNTPEAKIDQQQTAQEASPQIKSEENQANWKVFREQREADRKAKEVSDRMAQQKAEEAAALRAALEAITNKPNNSHQAYQSSEDTQETEEARIDRRVREIIKEREGVYETERQQREIQETPTRLKSAYNDFDKVCTAENLDYLEYHYPEVAMPFRYVPEGFDKWAAIYKAVKKFVPNTDSLKDASKADRNLAKPGSISATGNTHGGNAMPAARLDEARKSANWQRMQKSLKGLS